MLANNSSTRQDSKNRFLVCETGFGAGHSAALWLTSSPNIDVLVFDNLDRPYQVDCLELLRNRFPGRIKSIAGDTCKTVPQHFKADGAQPCDFVHASSLCPHDTHNLYKLSRCGTVVTASAMKSIQQELYFGEEGSGEWSEGCVAGWLGSVQCFKDVPFQLERDFVFAAKGLSSAHEFCVGVVTGQCGAGDETFRAVGEGAQDPVHASATAVTAVVSQLHGDSFPAEKVTASAPERVCRSGCDHETCLCGSNGAGPAEQLYWPAGNRCWCGCELRIDETNDSASDAEQDDEPMAVDAKALIQERLDILLGQPAMNPRPRLVPTPRNFRPH